MITEREGLGLGATPGFWKLQTKKKVKLPRIDMNIHASAPALTLDPKAGQMSRIPSKRAGIARELQKWPI